MNGLHSNTSFVVTNWNSKLRSATEMIEISPFRSQCVSGADGVNIVYTSPLGLIHVHDSLQHVSSKILLPNYALSDFCDLH